MIRQFSVALIAGAVCLLAACGGSDTGPNSVEAEISGLGLQPANLILQVRESQQLTTTVFDGTETPSFEAVEIIFRADKQAGRIDQEGRFTAGIKAGIYPDAITVVYSVDSVVKRSETANVTIMAGPLDHISLEPAIATVQMHHQQQFSATGFDRFKNPIVGLQFTFDAEDKTGRIDGNGNFTAGTDPGPHPDGVTVETEVDSVIWTAAAEVTVVGPIDRAVLDPAVPTIQVGEAKRFRVFAYDGFGNSIPKSMYEQIFNVNKKAGVIDKRGTFVAGAFVGTYTDGVFVQITQGNLVRRVATDLTLAHGPVNQVVRYPAAGVESQGAPDNISSRAYDQFGNHISDPSVLRDLGDESTVRIFLLRGPNNVLVWFKRDSQTGNDIGSGVGSISEVVLEFDVLTGDYWVEVSIDPDKPLTGNFRFNMNLANQRTGPARQSNVGVSVSLWERLDANSSDRLVYSGRNQVLTTWQPGDRITTFGPLFNSGIGGSNTVETSGFVIGDPARR